MHFAYHNRGQYPSSRAADARALGSLGGDHTLAVPTLPAPGAPEVMAGDCGCGCKGAGTCGAMGAFTDLFQQSNWPYLAAAGVAAYFLLKKKKRRR